MKVNTDSIVLGSWALSLIASPEFNILLPQTPTALDIGSGNGLLSIMLAQGFNGRIGIDAVEYDENASIQGCENVRNSPWPESITSSCADISTFVYHVDSRQYYDIIVSNPPYFPKASKPTRAYIKQNLQRKIARNQDQLSLRDLISIIDTRLSIQGYSFLCIPTIELKSVIQLAHASELSISHCLQLKSTPTKHPYLACLALTKTKVETQYSELIIFQDSNVYSSEFRTLCAPFYRDF